MSRISNQQTEKAPSPFLKKVYRLSSNVDKAVMWTCATMLIVMIFDLLIGIFCRYVLQNPFMWTEEVARYIMIWTASLAMSSGIRRGEHIAILYFTQRLSKNLAKAVDIFLKIILFGFLSVLTIFGVRFVISNLVFTSQALDLNMGFFVSAVPVAGALMMFQLVCSTILTYHNIKE
jgi:TRAP-type transport system small permease protein